MRSKMRTFASTAIPMVSTIPAMPGIVMVALSSDIEPRTSSVFTTRAAIAIAPATR